MNDIIINTKNLASMLHSLNASVIDVQVQLLALERYSIGPGSNFQKEDKEVIESMSTKINTALMMSQQIAEHHCCVEDAVFGRVLRDEVAVQIFEDEKRIMRIIYEVGKQGFDLIKKDYLSGAERKMLLNVCQDLAKHLAEFMNGVELQPVEVSPTLH